MSTDLSPIARAELTRFLTHAKTEGVFLVQWKGAQEDWHILTDEQRATLLTEWSADAAPDQTVTTALNILADTLAELAVVRRQLAEHVCTPAA